MIQASYGTVMWGIRPINDHGNVINSGHFSVVVSSDSANAKSRARLCAIMTHEPRDKSGSLDPFLAHTCWHDPSSGRPARRLGTICSWSLVQATKEQWSQWQRLGSCCDDGLLQFSRLWRQVVLGDSFGQYLQVYINKNQLPADLKKNCARLNAGDVIQVYDAGQYSIEVVISSNEFHKVLSSDAVDNATQTTIINQIDSVVAMRLKVASKNEGDADPSKIVWIREELKENESQEVSYYKPATWPRRLRLRTLRWQQVGSLTNSKYHALRKDVEQLLQL